MSEYNATPREALLSRLMSPTVPKSELEWFAKREVERLKAICREAWDSLPGTYADDDPLAARHAAALRGCHEAASAAGKES